MERRWRKGRLKILGILALATILGKLDNNIYLLQALNGKQNMILYFQGGVLKSHHTTFQNFDYNDVLDYEISPSYRVKYIF